jgi:hypothetical protein
LIASQHVFITLFEGLFDSGVETAETDGKFLVIHEEGIQSVFAIGELYYGFVAASDCVVVFQH